MKTRTLILAFLIISLAVNSQDWIEFAASESTIPVYSLIKSTDTIVEFEIDVPGMYSTIIDTFNRVQIKEHLKMDSIGFPEVPILSYLVAIPSSESVNLNLMMLDSVKISDINIYPAYELIADTTDEGYVALIEQFTYNRTAYETDEYFPNYFAKKFDNI